MRGHSNINGWTEGLKRVMMVAEDHRFDDLLKTLDRLGESQAPKPRKG